MFERFLGASRAWKRLLLDGGKLSKDGETVMRDLMRHCQYFGVGYEAGDHDKTLVLAARREVVNRILAAINYDENKIQSMLKEYSDE